MQLQRVGHDLATEILRSYFSIANCQWFTSRSYWTVLLHKALKSTPLVRQKVTPGG